MMDCRIHFENEGLLKNEVRKYLTVKEIK